MPAFAIKIREADDAERRHIEVQLAEHLASDHCIGIWLDDELIGWGDDYGTFHPMRPSLQRQEAGEATAGGGAGLLGGRAAMTDHPSQSVANLKGGVMEAEAATVKITFTYYPDEPDPGDSTGMSEEEYMRLMDQLASLGADDVQIEKG